MKKKNILRRQKLARKQELFDALAEVKPSPRSVSLDTNNHADDGAVTSRGVLMIISFDNGRDEELFAVIKDRDKPLLKFPFGGIEDSDKDEFAAASRESEEEIFGGHAPFPIVFEKSGKLGEITMPSKEGSGIHLISVLTTRLANGVKLTPGEEQEAVFRVSGRTIDHYIASGIYSRNHAIAWQMLKTRHEAS